MDAKNLSWKEIALCNNCPAVGVPSLVYVFLSLTLFSFFSQRPHTSRALYTATILGVLHTMGTIVTHFTVYYTAFPCLVSTPTWLSLVPANSCSVSWVLLVLSPPPSPSFSQLFFLGFFHLILTDFYNKLIP